METVDRHTLQRGAKLPCKGRKGSQAAGKNEAQRRSSGQPWPSSLRQHMAKGGTNTAAQWQGLRAQRCESGSIHRAEAVCREEKRIVGEKWETAAFVKAPQRAVRNANGASRMNPQRGKRAAQCKTRQITTNVQARPFGLAPRVGTLCGNASRCASQSVVIAAHV
ncbi:hypothetical protein ERJ75_001626200 [Trypanosoma vivax]|nr:hypothetical protein ERJ75_001626200 [Trypanosoma vivax]